MRKRFETEKTLDSAWISEVKLNKASRHELPKLLEGLQYIFVKKELNEAVFIILEKAVQGKKKATGRLGMSLWEILVMGTMRLNLNIDYDMLEDLVNNHAKVRGILGVYSKAVFGAGKEYKLQTIKDNVRLLDEKTLGSISEIVVKAGHELKKKEEDKGKEAPLDLRLKTDSYAVESSIHFPTDLNLLWDSGRKCLDILKKLIVVEDLKGWRKLKVWYKGLKKVYRTASDIHHRKGRNYKERLAEATKDYLSYSQKMGERLKVVKVELLSKALKSKKLCTLLEQLTYYESMLEKHIDLVDRRILQGEKIPHNEKVFSIFEAHTEWIQKGKHHKKVELGHNVLITSDQYHFIVDHKVMEGRGDSAQPLELAKRLKAQYSAGYNFQSISFDRGFYSQLAKKGLEGDFKEVIMPKKGKKTSKEKELESSAAFVEQRKKHSAVESNINELEHSGVDKVPDKGLKGFKNYVAWGVLAFNLKRLGQLLMQQTLVPNKAKKAA